ncbi:hypothetical protein GOP47_0028978 [Adiantum capillus-veneris]|nr:hypothetical protein GOP47_0028978 [Adiantum capillus-veneris]
MGSCCRQRERLQILWKWPKRVEVIVVAKEPKHGMLPIKAKKDSNSTNPVLGIASVRTSLWIALCMEIAGCINK